MLREVIRRTLRKLGINEWLVKGVMTIYNNVRTVVKTNHGNSEEFKVKVVILFMNVKEPQTYEARGFAIGAVVCM